MVGMILFIETPVNDLHTHFNESCLTETTEDAIQQFLDMSRPRIATYIENSGKCS